MSVGSDRFAFLRYFSGRLFDVAVFQDFSFLIYNMGSSGESHTQRGIDESG